MRFIHNIDPFIFRIQGEFGVRWYSIPYIIGFVLAYRWLKTGSESGAVPRLSQEALDRFIIYAIVGVLLGARFFHVFVFELDRYGFDPLAWVAVWRGGLSFHGGLVGAVSAIVLFARRERIPVYAITDRLAVPVAIGLGFGRIGNFINAEMYGTLYDGLLCVDYSQNEYITRPIEGCRHPTQLYEMAKNWFIAGLLAWFTTRRPRPGTLTWSFIGLYGLIRFFLMFVRDEARVIGPLTLSQVFSGLMAMLAAAALVWLFSRPPAAPAPANTVPRRERREQQRRRRR
jgi:phosphatidylglycerol---prolipoprotein diacylglyceryl transferase